MNHLVAVKLSRVQRKLYTYKVKMPKVILNLVVLVLLLQVSNVLMKQETTNTN